MLVYDNVDVLDGLTDPRADSSLDLLVGVISSAKNSSTGRCIVLGTRISDVREWIERKMWQVI